LKINDLSKLSETPDKNLDFNKLDARKSSKDRKYSAKPTVRNKNPLILPEEIL